MMVLRNMDFSPLDFSFPILRASVEYNRQRVKGCDARKLFRHNTVKKQFPGFVNRERRVHRPFTWRLACENGRPPLAARAAVHRARGHRVAQPEAYLYPALVLGKLRGGMASRYR